MNRRADSPAADTRHLLEAGRAGQNAKEARQCRAAAAGWQDGVVLAPVAHLDHPSPTVLAGASAPPLACWAWGHAADSLTRAAAARCDSLAGEHRLGAWEVEGLLALHVPVASVARRSVGSVEPHLANRNSSTVS